MKTKTSLRLALAVILLLAAGCKGRQEAAFDDAIAQENRARGTQVPAVVHAYEQVIALDPSSPIAGQARERLAALHQRIAKGEETHRDVFGEHGVD